MAYASLLHLFLQNVKTSKVSMHTFEYIYAYYANLLAVSFYLLLNKSLSPYMSLEITLSNLLVIF